MGETTVGENQGSRLSRMAVLAAVLSFLSASAGLLHLRWRVSNPYQRPCDVESMIFALIVLTGVVVAIALYRIRRSQGTLRGIWFARMGAGLAIISLFLLVSPNVTESARRARYMWVAGDANSAVTQAIKYAQDKGVYPTSLRVLREEGYGNIRDEDPWGYDWVLSPLLTEGRTPKEGDDVYVYSRGPKGTGVYPKPFTTEIGEGASTGYSSVDGYWSEYPIHCHRGPGLHRWRE